MSKRYGRILGFVAALLLLAASRDALAHRVNVFAYVEGDTVHMESYFNRSDRVHFGAVSVRNAATGQVYLTGKTDEQGNFAFPVPPEAKAQKADLRIVLQAGEGHQNDWVIKAEEYAGAATAAPSAPQPATPSAEATASPATSQAAPPAASPASGPQQAVVAVTDRPCPDAASLRPMVEQAVEAAVEKKIAPIRKILLDEQEKGPGMIEIFGGIGWLVGLAGLAAYGKSRAGGKGA